MSEEEEIGVIIQGDSPSLNVMKKQEMQRFSKKVSTVLKNTTFMF